MENLYNTDFYGWTKQQARLLKTGRFNELDLDNLVEEVKDMGKHEPRSLTNHLKQLLMHLLKWQFQPERQSRSWRDSIILQRDDARLVLDENPSLRPRVPEFQSSIKKPINRQYPLLSSRLTCQRKPSRQNVRGLTSRSWKTAGCLSLG